MSDILTRQVTDVDLAALAGVTTRRIRQLVESGRLVRIGRNRFNLADAFQALLEEMSGGDKAAELTAERVRKLRADASMSELELAKAQSEVAPIAECERVWNTYCVTLRANMLTIPARVASSLLGETDESRFKAVLREEITLALTSAAGMEIPEEEETADE